jgi:hypothetical protein
MRKVEKKGEITAYYLIGIVLAIFGLIVVLFLLFGLDLSLNSQKDVCKLSVLTRATSPEATSNYVPLKCTTEKICLTDSGECSEFFAEEDVTEIKLPDDEVEAAELIEKISAESMLECWKIFGEGKLSLFNNGMLKNFGWTTEEPTCVICNRIAVNFDNDDRRDNVFENVDMNDYLAKKNVPNLDRTYLQYFTDKQLNSFPNVVDQTPEDLSEIGIDINEQFNEIKTDEVAIVFSQIKTETKTGVLENLGKAGVAVVGGSFVSAPVTSIKAVSRLANPYVLVAAVAVVGGVLGYSMANVEAGRVAAASYCGDIEGISGDDNSLKEGCSSVQILPYDFRALNNACKQIDGNP